MSGSPPLRSAVQVTVSPTMGEAGSQLTASMTGAPSAGTSSTANVEEAEASPRVLATVSEMVLSPTESNVVLKLASAPVAGSPPPLQA